METVIENTVRMCVGYLVSVIDKKYSSDKGIECKCRLNSVVSGVCIASCISAVVRVVVIIKVAQYKAVAEPFLPMLIFIYKLRNGYLRAYYLL